jgi:hypothetical protein
MSLVTAPFRGTLEWVVPPGTDVLPNTVLAWLSVPDHCALRPLITPRGGRLTWRLDPDLATIEPGDPVALLDHDAEALARCLAHERAAARSLLTRLEQDALSQPPRSPLATTLLEPERRSLDARITRLRHLVDQPLEARARAFGI